MPNVGLCRGELFAVTPRRRVIRLNPGFGIIPPQAGCGIPGTMPDVGAGRIGGHRSGNHVSFDSA